MRKTKPLLAPSLPVARAVRREPGPHKLSKSDQELFDATEAGDVERLRRAIQKADLEARDQDGATALGLAAELGHEA